MVSKKNVNKSTRELHGDDDELHIREIIIKYLSYWPIFLICVAITMSGAFVYYKLTKPVFDIKATMLMHDDSKDKAADDKSALQELDLVNPPKIVENEIEILKSRSLVKLVVERLQLWTSYKLKDGLTSNDLYDVTPVKFVITSEGRGERPVMKLQVKVLSTSSYALVDEDGSEKKHEFKDVFTDAIGTWQISPTSNVNSFIGKTILINLSDDDSTIMGYQKAVDVVLKDKLASIVELSIGDQNPKRGEDFLNNLIYVYNQTEIAEKNNLTKSTINFIDKRLDSLVGELNTAEGKVEGFRSSKGLTDINAQSQVYLQNVQSNDSKLNDINVQLNVLNVLEAYVNSPNSSDRNTPSIIGISDPVLGGLVQKLSDFQLEKTKLLATLPERNPAFEPLNRQIATTKLAIKDNLKTIKTSLQATRNELQSFKSNNQSSISNIPGQERQLVGLKRQQSIKENLYTYLLQKREEISLSYASSLSNARLVDVAYASPPKASKRLIPFAVAFFLGLIFPAGFIYGKDIAGNKITKRREIEIATSLPVLTEFNFIKLNSELVNDEQNSDINFALVEQFRNLKTQLNIMLPTDDGGRVTLITSSVANEGKSFVSSNLAVALAKAGKKVVLLEMDIYKPKLLKKFGLSDKIGLADYLASNNQTTLHIQVPAKYPELHVIGCGNFVNNFSEFLDRPAFKQLLSTLRDNYDHILIDTPPVHAINDANIVAQHCDLTLFVIRCGHTSKQLFPFIRKLSTKQLLPEMNVIFNGLTEGRDSEGYQYEKYYKEKKK